MWDYLNLSNNSPYFIVDFKRSQFFPHSSHATIIKFEKNLLYTTDAIENRKLLLYHGLTNDLLLKDFTGKFVGISASTVEEKVF
jgi:hypothetical protein